MAAWKYHISKFNLSLAEDHLKQYKKESDYNQKIFSKLTDEKTKLEKLHQKYDEEYENIIETN